MAEKNTMGRALHFPLAAAVAPAPSNLGSGHAGQEQQVERKGRGGFKQEGGLTSDLLLGLGV